MRTGVQLAPNGSRGLLSLGMEEALLKVGTETTGKTIYLGVLPKLAISGSLEKKISLGPHTRSAEIRLEALPEVQSLFLY